MQVGLACFRLFYLFISDGRSRSIHYSRIFVLQGHIDCVAKSVGDRQQRQTQPLSQSQVRPPHRPQLPLPFEFGRRGQLPTDILSIPILPKRPGDPCRFGSLQILVFVPRPIRCSPFIPESCSRSPRNAVRNDGRPVPRASARFFKFPPATLQNRVTIRSRHR
jgi:hypothetical protein